MPSERPAASPVLRDHPPRPRRTAPDERRTSPSRGSQRSHSRLHRKRTACDADAPAMRSAALTAAEGGGIGPSASKTLTWFSAHPRIGAPDPPLTLAPRLRVAESLRVDVRERVVVAHEPPHSPTLKPRLIGSGTRPRPLPRRGANGAPTHQPRDPDQTPSFPTDTARQAPPLFPRTPLGNRGTERGNCVETGLVTPCFAHVQCVFFHFPVGFVGGFSGPSHADAGAWRVSGPGSGMP